MLRVLKFGGSILTGSEAYMNMANEVFRFKSNGDGVVVIVSAMKGVTDKLIEAARNPSSSDTIIEEIYNLYQETLTGLNPPSKYQEMLYKEFTNLASAIWAVRILGEVSPRAYDYIVSFGERFSSIVAAAALETRGIKSVKLLGGEAGIITDYNFGEANPLHKIARDMVKKKLNYYLSQGYTPVVTGFIGGTIDGAITLLGRGGSDFSATLIASYMGADEVLIYTVTGAVMSGDPRKIAYARPVSKMNFSEAAEVARLGLRKFHPRTFEPLIGSRIKVKITKVGGGPETVIDGTGGPPPVKAVTVYEDLQMIIVEGKTLPGKIGALAKAASQLANNNVNIITVVQPPSETSMVFIVEANDANRALNSLSILVDEGYATSVYEEGIVSAVSVVGEGVINPSITSRVHETALAEGGKVVVWSPASPSISVFVDPKVSWKLANILHDEVVLNG